MIKRWILSLTLLLLVALSGCTGSSNRVDGGDTPAISGTIEAGLRVLTIDPEAEGQHFTIYRGDYVRVVSTTGDPITIQIVDLEVDKTYPVAEGEKAYFKVPDAGRFAFSTGNGRGSIEAIEYSATAYKEVNSVEAAAYIANVQPLILDVRTAREYESGHIENSRLVPVQVFQQEVTKLMEHKNEPVFVYCRSGNRSTVAAKILVDRGFTNVVNLRRGLAEWRQAGQEVVK